VLDFGNCYIGNPVIKVLTFCNSTDCPMVSPSLLLLSISFLLKIFRMLSVAQSFFSTGLPCTLCLTSTSIAAD
jgi:hypothetical protein